MSTGLPAIDRQHEILLDRLDDLTQAMIDGRGLQQLPQALVSLDRLCASQFADEEHEMAVRRCPMAAYNKQAHADFLRRLRELRQSVETHGASAGGVRAALHDLSSWLVIHIKGCDAKLKACA
jgi:hemerythrin-like metal-binding protein